MKKTVLHTLLLLAACCTPHAGRAQEPDSVRHYDVAEVVVTATRTPLALKDTPVITRVIAAADIAREGIVSLPDLLQRELAGVEFHQAGYGTSMSFQGLDARYVLILVDGERIAGETYGNIDYSRIPLSDIERIEIVRGASSVLYGSNAMGAVVNIITRMPKKRVEVRGSVRYGTRYQSNGGEELGKNASEADLGKYRDKIDLPNAHATLSLGLNLGKVRSLTAFSYRTVDAYKAVGRRSEERRYRNWNLYRVGYRPGTGVAMIPVHRTADTTVLVAPDSRGLGVSGWSDLSLSQRLDYRLSDKFRFELSGGYFRKRRYDFFESIVDENPMPAAMTGKQWAWHTYEGYNVKALMEHSPSRFHKVYLSYMRDVYDRGADSLSGVHTHKQRHVYNIPRLLWTWNGEGIHRLTTGVELVNEQLNLDLRPEPYSYADKVDMNTVSAYLQDELLSGRRLSFVAGLRGEYNNRFGWRATPKLSAKFDWRRLTLRANYSNGYRTPSLKEMYMELTIPMPGLQQIVRGNQNLKPESNHYLSLSAEYENRGLDLSATVYNSFFRNKIDVVGRQEGTATVLLYENIDKSRIDGLELTARWRPARRWLLQLDYNWIYRNSNTPGGDAQATQYIFPSPHTATLNAEYAFSVGRLRVGVNGAVRYIGAKEYEDFMSIIDLQKATVVMGSYASSQPGYAVCDLSANFDFRGRVALTVGVENLFDHSPAVVSFNSGVTAPRSGFARLSFDF